VNGQPYPQPPSKVDVAPFDEGNDDDDHDGGDQEVGELLLASSSSSSSSSPSTMGVPAARWSLLRAALKLTSGQRNEILRVLGAACGCWA
jgi:hypothetical protein